MNIGKRLAEINARKVEIRGILEGNSEVNLDEIKTELSELDAEAKELRSKQEIAKSINSGDIEARKIEKPVEKRTEKDFSKMSEEELLSTPEYRSAFLKRLQGKELTEVEKRTATTTTAAAAVPTQTMNMIVDKLRQTAALFNKISVSYIKGNVKLVIANAKNAAAWNTEGGDGTPADDTVTYVSLAGFELIKLAEISAAESAMTIDAFESYIVAEIGRQMAIAIENTIINGAGTTEPTGILNGVTFNASNSVQYTSDIDYDDIMDGIALLPTLYHQNAEFVMSRKTFFAGVKKIRDAEGEPIFVVDPTQPAVFKILGYNVTIDDYIADDIILFGDFSYYYMNIAQAVEIASDKSIGFKSGKTTYRGLAVIDGKPALSEAFVKIYK